MNQCRVAPRIGALVGASLILSSCGAPTNMLAPRGPAAARIADLWWFMFAIAGVIFVVVVGLLAFALFRSRRGEAQPLDRPADATRLIVGGGILTPVVVLLITFGLTLWTMNVLNAYAREPAATIQVIGHQWWWEVRYPEQGIVSANEIHIPVGQPVRIELSSADVVHNFWVPELAGKMDLVPGKTNTFWLQADQVGTFRGKCAEYCGTQHAKMEFLVIAEPAEQYATWVARQQQPAPIPADALLLEGQQAFLGASCVYCHAIRGTNANSAFGPDLTHLASRQSIAAGALANTRANLAGWITNPHSVKPGNKMPAVVLEPRELNALLAYLESLK